MRALGSVQLKEGRLVIYVARSLTSAGKRYYRFEREPLFAITRLHNYVGGWPAEFKRTTSIWKIFGKKATPKVRKVRDSVAEGSNIRVDPLSPRL